MAAASDPGEVLHSTAEKTNFQRITRLLIAGGTCLLREIFDDRCPPTQLPTKLGSRATQNLLKTAKLTKPQWDCLYPSPGAYGKSTDFDVTLLFRLLRQRTICGLATPSTGWDVLPAVTDHSLPADLARIKFYRNKVYGHVVTMGIRSDDFLSLWEEISKALIRIAGSISQERKTKWQEAIIDFLKNPLTEEDERNVEELKRWYKADTEVKESIENLKNTITQEGNRLETAVREESQATRDELRQSIDRLSSSTACSQSAGARLQLHINCEAIIEPGQQGRTGGTEVTPQASQAFPQPQPVVPFTSSEQLTVLTKGVGVESVRNGGIPSTQEVMNAIASKAIQAVDPYKPGVLDQFLQYLTKVRSVLVLDTHQGSLIITVECSSLQILDDLWEDYCSGHLNEMAQKFLVTEDILDAFGLIKVKLKTTISEEEYRACREYFLKQPDEAAGATDVHEDESTHKRIKLEATGDQRGKEGAMDVPKNVESGLKRKKSETCVNQSEDDAVATGGIDVHGGESTPKRVKPEAIVDQEGKEAVPLDHDVVFALDCSSSVSEKDFEKELNFSKQIAESWHIPLDTLFLYGDKAIPFHLDGAKPQFDNTCRRMDLALTEAAGSFGTKSNNDQLVVLITAGRQVSGTESRDDERDRLKTASEALSERNIKVVVVAVGLDTDFKELGLIVKRPQSFYPLFSFDDMTPEKANYVASNIRKTLDIEAYTKEQYRSFSVSGIPQESDLWEKISLCSDVLEGAWYWLYDDKKKQRPQKVKNLIRESIDNFQRTLVSDSKITISLAVFGNQGKGKSLMLNFLLNLLPDTLPELPDVHKAEIGPLPSGIGRSKTPVPVYVRYGKNVRVLLRKNDPDANPVVWVSEEELGGGTITHLKNALEAKFEEVERLSDASCVEVEGPFPVLRHLNERATTASSHLVDVEFVDLPGCGAEVGDETISDHLSVANIVLFFNSADLRSGRPVSSECIAQIFRRHKGFEFESRPKLVHVVNDEEKSTKSSSSFEEQEKEKKEDLEKAWSCFLSSSSEDDSVRSKLPQLNAEALLEKLKGESDLIYFHAENPRFLASLERVVNDHVHSVMVKKIIHPFLQDIYWAAKKLKARYKDIRYTEKKRSDYIDPPETSFELELNRDTASDLTTFFMDQTELTLHSDLESMYFFLYNKFLYSSYTIGFVLEMLKESLEVFTSKLIFEISSKSRLQDIPSDELCEMLVKGRVQEFCENTAPGYLRQVLDKGKTQIHSPSKQEKTDWSSGSDVERKSLLRGFLQRLLERTRDSLAKGTRGKQKKKSCYELIQQLTQDARDLIAISCADNPIRASMLEQLNVNLTKVINFCIDSIREINPHPSLDVQSKISLPEKMMNAHKDEKIPLQSSHKKIIEEVTDLLKRLKEGKGKRRSKEVIYQLETKLKLKHKVLELQQSRNVDQRLWELALVNVLSDKDHFDVHLDPSLVLDHPPNTEVERLLSLARERLFAYQKSHVTCKVVSVDSLSAEVPIIRLQKSKQEENCLEVLVSPVMSEKLDTIRKESIDPWKHLVPIFIPTVRPGPTPDIQGNFFLEEDPWSRSGIVEEEGEGMEETRVENSQSSVLNLFLVVEPQHLHTLQATIDRRRHTKTRNVNLMYVVLPQNGRGIGVMRSIIKLLAECFKFSLYWTIDDDIQFMYQYDGNDHRWRKCSITRGLLFGQRVFQTCLEETVKEFPYFEGFKLFTEITSNWPSFAEKTKAAACQLLMDRQSLADVQKNPNLLHQPFSNIPDDCGGDSQKEEELKAFERAFVDKCRERLFKHTINHIASVSIAHENTKKSDFMSKYPKAHYMRSEQRSQVVLNHAYALKGRNFVTDEMLLIDEEFQVRDDDKCSTPHWGIKGSEKSFSSALTVGGVISYQAIQVFYSQKKRLRSVFDMVSTSFVPSQAEHSSEDMDDNK